MRVDDRGLVKELDSIRRERDLLKESLDGSQQQLKITQEDLKAALDRLEVAKNQLEDTDQQLKATREELKELQKKLLQVEEDAAKERDEASAKIIEATRRTILAENELESLKEQSKISVDVDPSDVIDPIHAVDASDVLSQNDSGIEACIGNLNVDFENIFSQATLNDIMSDGNLSGFDSSLFEEA